jgi:hypothetical protein
VIREFFVDRGLEAKRTVLVPVSVNLEIEEPSPNWSSMALTLDLFRAGQLVTVSRRREIEADFKLMDEVDEVWITAFRKPRGIQRRLLGRFLEKDVFVGLGLHDRRDLAGRKYVARANDVIADWGNRFGDMQPLRSDRMADYFGHVFRDLDDD